MEGGRGVEVTGVGGGYQGNRVRAQQGVRDSRRGCEVEKRGRGKEGGRERKETDGEGARQGDWGGRWGGGGGGLERRGKREVNEARENRDGEGQ